MTHSATRKEYGHGGLSEADVAADPIEQFQRWFAEAVAAEHVEPNAMTLATATPNGVPSARVVLLKLFDERGFVFFTNRESQKGHELEANPHAALVFYWDKLERQVRIVGVVEPASDAEADKYFADRPRGSQLGACASRQSSVLADRTELEHAVAKLDAEYAGRQVPRPSFWVGYRVVPTTVEFWQGRPSRLHDRILFTRSADGSWTKSRLSP